MSPALSTADPLAVLRGYRALAPWALGDLASLSGSILEASGIVPLSAAAQARPTARTIRFYVTRGLVDRPEGKGTAAVYSYRHLLQVLAIKLRQMEGVTLEAIVAEGQTRTGDAVERRVAATLGPSLVAPELLGWQSSFRGRSGRVNAASQRGPRTDPAPSTCRRIPVRPGVEVVVDATHPVLRNPDAESTIVAAVRSALSELGGNAEE